MNIKAGNPFNASASWLVHPNHFYVQLVSESAKICLSHLENQIRRLADDGGLEKPDRYFIPIVPNKDDEYPEEDEAEDLRTRIDITRGDLVLAPCREVPDQCLLRGQILDQYDETCLGTHFKIKFVDYGMEQFVHFDDIFRLSCRKMASREDH